MSLSIFAEYIEAGIKKNGSCNATVASIADCC